MAASSSPPPIAILGGRLFGSEAPAMWIEDGKIRMLGAEDRVRHLAKERGAQVVDIKGGLVLPGIVDCHLHVVSLGLTRIHPELSECRTIEEAARKVAAYAAKAFPRGARAGAWIVGRGWRADAFPGGAYPDAADLDRFVPDLPVALWSVDGHACWANAAAMRLAGVTKATDDPAGGRIRRRADGTPAGIFFEAACSLIWRHVPQPSGEEMRAALREALDLLARAGFTGCHDAGDLRTIEAAAEADDEDPLPIRFCGMFRPSEADSARQWLERNRGRERVRAVAAKMFLDGSFTSRTAWRLRPYADGSVGICTALPDEIDSAIDAAGGLGFPVAMHAIGDRAVREALDAIERAAVRHPDRRGLRHRIEHAQLIHPDDIVRFGRLKAIVSAQPQHLMMDWRVVEADYRDPESLAYPYRSLRRAGAALCLGSDAPVMPGDRPGDAVYAAVERLDESGRPEGGWMPGEKMEVGEILDAFSRGAAWAEGVEGKRGRIAEGFDADLTLLACDVRDLRGPALRRFPVTGIVVAGAARLL